MSVNLRDPSRTHGEGQARTAALSFLLIVMACVCITVVMNVQLNDFNHHRSAATAIAKGTVVEDAIGANSDIRVRWSDDSGTQRTTQLEIYDIDRYVTGKPFTVRFDPANPGERIYPAEQGETAAEDGFYAWMMIPWPLVVVFAIWWLLRLIRGGRSQGAAELADVPVIRDLKGSAAPVTTILAWAAFGAVVACLPGIAFGSTTMAWIGAVLGTAAAVNLWALYGADR